VNKQWSRLEEVNIEELKGRLLHEKEYWGGAYMTAIEGFAGLHHENGVLKMKACLPSGDRYNDRKYAFELIYCHE
jgi:hypothetical protein